MADITLYHAIPSRGLFVHWLLEELDVPFSTVLLDIEAEEQKGADYRAINPMGKMPALTHGDKTLTETAAICFYLAEQFPQSGLTLAADSPQRADYLRWFFFGPATMEPAIAAAATGFAPKAYQPFADVTDVANTLCQQLADKPYITGDQFCAADVVIGGTINWGLHWMPVLPERPEIIDYWKRLEQRPAWQKVLATMKVIPKVRTPI